MSGVSIGAAIAVVAQDVIKAHGRTRLMNWCTLADVFLGVGFLLVLTRAFGFVGASLYISLTVLIDAAILLGLAQQLVIVPLRRVLTVLAPPIPGLLIATMATWWLEHDTARRFSRADSRGHPVGRRCPGVLPALPGGADPVRAIDSGHDHTERTRPDRRLPGSPPTASAIFSAWSRRKARCEHRRSARGRATPGRSDRELSQRSGARQGNDHHRHGG